MSIRWNDNDEHGSDWCFDKFYSQCYRRIWFNHSYLLLDNLQNRHDSHFLVDFGCLDTDKERRTSSDDCRGMERSDLQWRIEVVSNRERHLGIFSNYVVLYACVLDYFVFQYAYDWP